MLPTVSFRSTIGANITVNSTKKTEEQTIYKVFLYFKSIFFLINHFLLFLF